MDVIAMRFGRDGTVAGPPVYFQNLRSGPF
jgi:hypothetical protein